MARVFSKWSCFRRAFGLRGCPPLVQKRTLIGSHGFELPTVPIEPKISPAENNGKYPGRLQRSGLELKMAEPFSTYLSPEEFQAEVKTGSLGVGTLRINPRNYQQCYLPDPSGGRDILIDGLYARNRALDGDKVVYRLHPRSRWVVHGDPGGEGGVVTQKTAAVVAVHTEVNKRYAVCLPIQYDRVLGAALFSPRDHRKPRIVVPLRHCPQDFLEKFSVYKKKLFALKIMGWKEDGVYADGSILEVLGDSGNLATEHESLLREEGMELHSFSEEQLEEVRGMTAEISDEEWKTRRDFRSFDVFSVDPENARDADDAVHWRSLPEKKYEVGVHIADVTHFVQPGSLLDQHAAKQCFTIYLVPRAVHNLPPELSENLCSLRPYVERRVVSCVFTFNSKHKIIDTWMGRGVIHSKGKLNYGQAEALLRGERGTKFLETLETVPGSLPAIVGSVVELDRVTQVLQKQRRGRGYVSLNNPKLQDLTFSLDDDGNPRDCQMTPKLASCRLVEELMLLANQSVGEYLARTQPNVAVFRTHFTPLSAKLSGLKQLCDSIDGARFPNSIDHKSLMGFLEGLKSHPLEAVLNLKFLTCLDRSTYMCFSAAKENLDVSHFALNMKYYAHFSSPLRRYPDIIVHRQLLLSLAGEKLPVDLELSDQLATCNVQEKVTDFIMTASSSLYFGAYIMFAGELHAEAIVTSVEAFRLKVFVEQFAFEEHAYPAKSSVGEPEDKSIVGKPEEKSASLPASKGNNNATPSLLGCFEVFQKINVIIKHSPSDQKPYAYTVVFGPPDMAGA